MNRDVLRVLLVITAALAVIWAVMAPGPVAVPVFDRPALPAPTAEFRYKPLPHTTPWGPRLTEEHRP